MQIENGEMGVQQMDKRKRPWSKARKAEHAERMKLARARKAKPTEIKGVPAKQKHDRFQPKIVAPYGKIITIHEGEVKTWLCRYGAPDLLVLTPE